MENYKIKVNDEAESKEAQELLEQLGFRACNLSLNVYPKEIGTFNLTSYTDGRSINPELACRELTLPQLRDLVVLKRNDVKDATHADNYHDGSLRFFMTSDRDVYVYETNGFQRGWMSSGIYPKELKPIQPEAEQGLISGADALRALADGENVQWISKDFHKWDDLDTWNANTRNFLDEKCIIEGGFKYRLKPRTITLSLEIPAPFEPKDGEEAWCLDGNTLNGYKKVICDDFIDSGIGFWRTEEEIKQVVAALRGIKG